MLTIAILAHLLSQLMGVMLIAQLKTDGIAMVEMILLLMAATKFAVTHTTSEPSSAKMEMLLMVMVAALVVQLRMDGIVTNQVADCQEDSHKLQLKLSLSVMKFAVTPTTTTTLETMLAKIATETVETVALQDVQLKTVSIATVETIPIPIPATKSAETHTI